MAILLLATMLLGANAQTPTARGAVTAYDLPVVTPGPSVTLADVLKAADQRNLTLAAA